MIKKLLVTLMAGALLMGGVAFAGEDAEQAAEPAAEVAAPAEEAPAAEAYAEPEQAPAEDAGEEAPAE